MLAQEIFCLYPGQAQHFRNLVECESLVAVALQGQSFRCSARHIPIRGKPLRNVVRDTEDNFHELELNTLGIVCHYGAGGWPLARTANINVERPQDAIQVRIPVIAVAAVVEDESALKFPREQVVRFPLADPLGDDHTGDLVCCELRVTKDRREGHPIPPQGLAPVPPAWFFLLSKSERGRILQIGNNEIILLRASVKL